MKESPDLLQQARALGAAQRYPEMTAVCGQLVEGAGGRADVLMQVGVLYAKYGFLSKAGDCFQKCRALAPDDAGPALNLASLARDAGNPADSRRINAALQKTHPDNALIRRNLLLGQQYDASATDVERLEAARSWGYWAVERAGGERPRPASTPAAGRALRVGYVSADIHQHTVGWFVKDVIRAHDPGRVAAFVYSAGGVQDRLTEEIRAASSFRNVSGLDDARLAELVKSDRIDVLVDLSGHTGGSRLTAFALRPAPVQVSWLGYFATTGLSTIDAVILDAWHAPAGTKAQFVEKIARLPGGRLCYQPVPFAPEIPPRPARDHVVFGSFNNTSKLNGDVFEVWAHLLHAVPKSRLILKWMTFHDDQIRRSVLEAFERRGLRAPRIELRGPSTHADLLREYADIDVALDPFPFSGGMTSCEALWMGVPVVTWPQSRVVSRQTFAILSAIGLPELAAKDAAGYLRIAAGLAGDPARLAALRTDLRDRMRASSLMDVPGFTAGLEACFRELFEEFRERA